MDISPNLNKMCHVYCLHPHPFFFMIIIKDTGFGIWPHLTITHLTQKAVSKCSVLIAIFCVTQLCIIVSQNTENKNSNLSFFHTCTENINNMMPPSRTYSQSIRPPLPFRAYSGSSVFCTGENVAECMQYISKVSIM